MQFTLLEIDDMHKGLWLKKKDHELNLLKLLNVKKKKNPSSSACIFPSLLQAELSGRR